MYKSTQRKKQHVPSKGTEGGMAPYMFGPAGIPNSMLMSAHGDEPFSDSSSQALKDQILARQPGAQLHRQAQIPQAESEADRLSASVTVLIMNPIDPSRLWT